MRPRGIIPLILVRAQCLHLIKSFLRSYTHPQIPNFERVLSTFLQIKVAVIAFHLLISGLPVHAVLVWICLTPPIPSYIPQDWLTLVSTRQKGAPACRSKWKRKKGWEVHLVFVLFHLLSHYSFVQLLATCKNHIWGCLFSHINLSLNSPPREVIGNPWRCSSTSWTNTGLERDRCIITTTSCVSWEFGLGNVVCYYRSLT